MKTKKLLFLTLLGLMCSIGNVWSAPVTIGITNTTTTTSKTSTTETLNGSGTDVVVAKLALSSSTTALSEYTTGDKALNDGSSTSVYSTHTYKWNKNTGSTIDDSYCNTTCPNEYVGFSFTVAEGKTFSISGISAKLASSANHVFRIRIETSAGTVLYAADAKTINRTSDNEQTISNLNSSNAANIQSLAAGTYYVKAYLAFNSTGKYLVFTKLQVTGTVATAASITSQTLSGVKVDGSALTVNASTDGYSVSENTITLSDDIQYSVAPSDITLTNHIVYSDTNTDDEDVEVSFDGTITSGYYIGSATIGSTDYTIRVKQDVTPTLSLSASSASITLKSWEAAKINYSTKKADPITVTLTGSNLKDDTYSVSATGLTITPASFTVSGGSVEQEFSILTTSTTAASTDIVFTAKDAENNDISETFTLSMTRPEKRSLSQSFVTEATTWDWSNAASEEILLTKVGSDEYDVNSDPARGDEFLMAILPEVTNDETFNSQALKINTQYVKRTGDYFQGNSVKFKTNLSGRYNVIVWFSNTGKRGDSDPNRLIYIDGVNTEVGSKNTTFVSASATLELTGVEKEIVINAFTDDVTPASTMVRIQKIVFMPASVSGTISSIGWNSFASAYPLDLSTLSFSSGEGAAYYAYDKDIENNVITLSSTNATIAAGEGILIKGEAGETFSIHTKESGDALSGNLLVGVTANSTPVSSPYVLAGAEADKPYFQQYSGSTMNANSAYLPSDVLSATADRIRFVIEGEQNATGMEDVKAGVDVIKFIENSQLLIKKNGIVYDVTGRIVK